MKRKLLAFALCMALVFVFFGVACGGDNSEGSNGVSSDGSWESSSNSSVNDIAEVVAAEQLFPWIADLTVDNVVFVQQRYGGTGAPDSLSTVKTSTDKTEITRIIEYLNNLEFAIPLSGVDYPTGGLGTCLTVATDESVYTLYEYFGILTLDGQGYYYCEDIPTFTTGETAFCFASLFGDSVLYIDGVEMKNYGDLAHEILFVEKDDLKGFTYTGYELKFDGGTLMISDEKTFGFVRSLRATDNITLYTVVGETDFSQIFADYPLSA